MGWSLRLLHTGSAWHRLLCVDVWTVLLVAVPCGQHMNIGFTTWLLYDDLVQGIECSTLVVFVLFLRLRALVVDKVGGMWHGVQLMLWLCLGNRSFFVACAPRFGYRPRACTVCASCTSPLSIGDSCVARAWHLHRSAVLSLLAPLRRRLGLCGSLALCLVWVVLPTAILNDIWP